MTTHPVELGILQVNPLDNHYYWLQALYATVPDLRVSIDSSCLACLPSATSAYFLLYAMKFMSMLPSRGIALESLLRQPASFARPLLRKKDDLFSIKGYLAGNYSPNVQCGWCRKGYLPFVRKISAFTYREFGFFYKRKLSRPGLRNSLISWRSDTNTAVWRERLLSAKILSSVTSGSFQGPSYFSPFRQVPWLGPDPSHHR